VPTAPAIANAVYDAIGVRIKSLPITPEKVLKALRERT
jgi:CO/xanthine dehydrogenase Mo-binding subunit